MYMMCVSLNYHRLPAAVRENFVFAKEDLPRANRQLNAEKSIFENVILATCNRTEVYAVVDQIHTGRYYIKRFLASWFHVTVDELKAYAEVQVQEEAVGQLLNVATGLDSIIKGEPQILGQVKAAFAVADENGTPGVMLNHLFRQAITFAKRMHTQYRVSEFAQTSSQAGLHQIKVQLGGVKGKRLAVVGLGQMGQQVVRNASTMGFTEIVALNRHHEIADTLTARYPVVTSAPWTELAPTLKKVDAVVLATAARQPIIPAAQVVALRATQPVVIDLGMPRNVDVTALTAAIPYFDIDHLQAIISENETQKQAMFAAMAAAVEPEVADFFLWQKQLNIVPVIRALREQALSVEATSYDGLLRQLPDLDAHQRKVISKHMKGVINQMIKDPIKEIKELSVDSTADADINFFCRIFGLHNLSAGAQHVHEE
ncbi:glutamyl-tRNA reductase [Levilactobacillus cerevisiae]|uniref:glutamyl-tRNA reductase n=1 Tax=Levilactobacillus cerevisiae TaxID=1704076 RepID=UPI000F792104|nr:glutamyl-tRNA reductase [Levilactobacillus cerevisiae]